MSKLVIIEDEPDLQAVLDYNLRQAGHEVVIAGGGNDGINACRRERPDVVLLDLMLPDLPGTEVCKALRADPSTRGVAILMLTAKGEEIDRVVGFELGADDYMTKPFSMRELLLRVQAVARRAVRPGEVEDEDDVIRFGTLRVEKGAHRVFVAGKEVELTALELKLLVALAERKNRVQSRETLLQDVWGVDPSICSRTVDTHIKRLREKLGAAADYVETVRGAGYRFAETPGERA